MSQIPENNLPDDRSDEAAAVPAETPAAAAPQVSPPPGVPDADAEAGAAEAAPAAPAPEALAEAEAEAEAGADAPAVAESDAAALADDATAPADAAAAPDPTAPAGAAQQQPARPDLSPAACAALLAEHFPALFGAGITQPIKLRIQADIQQRTPGVFSRKALSHFLHRHTTSTAYLKALIQAASRFDLDGAPAGEIDAEHRAAAAAEVERRRAIVAARRGGGGDDREARGGPRGPQGPRREDRRAPPAAGAPPVAAAESGSEGAAGGNAMPAAPPPHHRPPQPHRQHDRQRPDRPPRAAGAPARRPGDRPGRDGIALPRAFDHPDRPGPQQHARGPAQQPPRPQRSAPPAGTPEGPETFTPNLPPAEIQARRDRAALLRAYETSTLTKSNFCVLKRLAPAELDAQLVLAQQERGERGREVPPLSRPPGRPGR